LVQKVCGNSEKEQQKEADSPQISHEHDKPFDITGIEISQIRSPKYTQGISIKMYACYLGAAFIDVEANFLIIQAYNYTSITSIMLLDCFTIPCAMGLSYLFLGYRFNHWHLIGVLLCISGLICIFISDSLSEEEINGSFQFYGDFLALFGSSLYAVSNVSQEYLVKYYDRDEYLGYVGSFGAAISFVQMMVLDYKHMKKTVFSSTIILSICGFVSCLFFMYTNTSAFLQYGDSTLFNLSLLTSDVYAILFSYFFYGSLVKWLYFLAFALVAIGLIIYHSAESPAQNYNNGSSNDEISDTLDNNTHNLRVITNLKERQNAQIPIRTVPQTSTSFIEMLRNLFNKLGQNSASKSSSDINIPNKVHQKYNNRQYNSNYNPLVGDENNDNHDEKKTDSIDTIEDLEGFKLRYIDDDDDDF
jgi:drug/metabolite transporter (DMT)-like permease